MKKAVTFDSSAAEFLLSTLGYSIDQDGYIIDEKSKKRALASDSKEIKWEELAAIHKDGQLFRRSPASSIKFSDILGKSAAKA